jgi:general stress protein YciG
MKLTKEIREYMRSIGADGGRAVGQSKVRGDAEYYQRISRKAAAARAAKRKGVT